MVQFWRMQLNKLYSGNKFEFPVAGTLTHKRNTNTCKEQKCNPCRTKTKGWSSTTSSTFSPRFLLLITNNMQIERQEIMTTGVTAIHPTNTKPEITAGISYIYWVNVMLSSRSIFYFLSIRILKKSISSSHPSQTAYAKRASFGISEVSS